jgi:hypothetical protein
VVVVLLFFFFFFKLIILTKMPPLSYKVNNYRGYYPNDIQGRLPYLLRSQALSPIRRGSARRERVGNWQGNGRETARHELILSHYQP